jgi:glycosyltransferase involved in cell wall biosynthesis
LSRIALICPTRTRFHVDSEAEQGLGGIEGANIALGHALSRLGHEVVLHSRADAPRRSGALLNLPLEALEPGVFDVLIASNDARWLKGARDGARSVAWIHNPLSIEKAVRRGQFPPLLRLRPDAVFVGRKLMEGTSRLLPYGRRTVIGLGVDARFLAPREPGPREDAFVFASQRQRGLAPLLAAWRAAGRRRPPDAAFHVFGTERREMGMTESEAGLAGIVFHGRVTKDALLEAYAKARAMLIPGAMDETFCLAAAEAQCLGLPVVTMGIGSLSERVTDGVDGVLCGDHGAMVESALRLAADPALFARLSAGASAQRDRLRWDGVAAEWEALLAEPAA